MGPFLAVRCFGLTIRVSLITAVTLVVVIGGAASRTNHTSPLGETGIAIGALVVVTFTLVVHELVRAIAFRNLGTRLRGIDLSILGGSPRVNDATTSPRGETIAGVVGLISAGLIASATLAVQRSTQSRSPAHDLATISLIAAGSIAVAQSTPALPFDGGRILRAFIWHLTDDPVRGSRGAAIYGHFISAILIAVGFIMLTQPDSLPYWGFGAIVAGVQIVTVSARSVRDSMCQIAARDRTVESLGLPWPIRIRTDEPVMRAADHFMSEGNSAVFLVVNQIGEPVGYLRFRYLHRAKRASWDSTPITTIMESLQTIPVATSNTPVEVLVDLLGDDPDAFALAGLPGREVVATRRTIERLLFDRSRSGELDPK